MKSSLRQIIALLALPATLLAADNSKNCGCACCKDKPVCCCNAEKAAGEPAKPAEAPARHPLKGIVKEVYAERSALMVKHEDIPGFMRSMTMMFKVEPAVLKMVHQGDSLTATLVERDGDFWLEDVKPAAK